MLCYPVNLILDDNATILVDFVDFPEAHTFGEDSDEALMRATDALESVLAAYMELRREIPQPSKPKRGQRTVSTPPMVEAKVELYAAMRATGVGKAELARRLNCHMPQVDRLLNLAHNSRLDQVEAALLAVGKRIEIAIVDAA